MRFFIIFSAILTWTAIAQISYMPPAFKDKYRKLIFMDIYQAYHQLNFKSNNDIEVVSRLDFNILESGYPLFDLVPSENLKVYYPKKRKKGTSCLAGEILSGDECLHELKFYQTNFNSYVEPMFFVDKHYLFPREGKSSLYFIHTLKEANSATGVIRKTGFNFVFEFCDGNSKRQLLERYLPANLQFDQYPMTLEVKFDQKFKNQKIITNDQKQKRFTISDQHYILKYPKFFNSASIFFHTYPEGYLFEYPKRKISGVDFFVYGKSALVHDVYPTYGGGYQVLKDPWKDISLIMDELTSRMGDFPHKEMIVYIGEGFSGIEHFGATRTSFFSLGHELYHQYIGRGVFPADGRSAWIDEGLARWRDGGHWLWRYLGVNYFVESYSSLAELPGKYVGLPDQSIYQRRTRHPDYKKEHAYAAGSVFFSHINHMLNGRLNDLLKDFVQSRMASKNYMYDQQEFKIYMAKWAHDHGFNALKVMDLFDQHFNANQLD